MQPPRDIFAVYIDNEAAAQFVDTQGWSDVTLVISPGPHTIDLSYQYNMFAVSPLPPSPPGRLGIVWVDNVVIESLPAAERAIEVRVVIRIVSSLPLFSTLTSYLYAPLDI